MSPGERPPPRFETPKEWICKWCGDPRPRHCKCLGCRWYPCKPCKVVTILDGPTLNDEGSWRWKLRWVTVHPRFFL